MNRMISRWLAIIATAILCFGAAGVANASSGFIALEGSDSTAFHQDPQYSPQLFKYLQGSSALPVLIIGDVTIQHTGGVSTVYTSSLSGQTLSDYSALYIESPGGCCTAEETAINGYGASVKSFIAAGGNFSIENYVGGDYDGVVPGAAGAPMGSILGYGTGGGGPGCTDGELVTAFGTAKGFTQPPVDGCWEHQAYQMSYWGKLGYQSLIASDPAGYTFGDGSTEGSAFLALGGTLGSTGVPEPATWALMILGFGAIGSVLRRRKAASTTVSFA